MVLVERSPGPSSTPLHPDPGPGPARRTTVLSPAASPVTKALDPSPTAAHAGTVAGTRPRHAWVDVARGLVVTMVVVMHVGIYHYLPMTQGEGANAFWTGVNSVLQVLRMPSLLILSGWLAGSRIRAGLGDPRTRRSIAANAYLYVLWLALYTVIAVALGATTMAQAPAPSTFLGQLLTPYSTLWFLAALAWYTLALAALRRAPAAAVLAGLFALGWVSTVVWPVEYGLWANIPHMAIFFGIGVYARPAIEAIGRRPVVTLVAGVGVATLAGEIARSLTASDLPAYPATVAQSLAGVAAVFGAASLLTRYAERATRPLAWVGRRTLAIYVGHYPVIMLLSTVSAGALYDVDRAVLADGLGAWLYPILATGMIVLVGVVARELAGRLRLGWLFQMPQRTPLARPLRAALTRPLRAALTRPLRMPLARPLRTLVPAR